MSFSSALYYPSIDISDESWLKSAVLFWDKINTIVPAAVKNPYNNSSSLYLYDEGILNPIIVNPDSFYVKKASFDVLKYVNTDDFADMCNFPRSMYRDMRLSRIHPQKLHYILADELERYVNLHTDNDGFYNIDSEFVELYMTLLANAVSEDKSLAVVSNSRASNQLIQTAKFDSGNKVEVKFDMYSDDSIKQGILTNYVIDNIMVSESTSLNDILDFRKHHKDELARFRTNLSELVEPIKDVPSFEALQESIKTKYNDEFIPAYHDLQKALNSSRIQWFFDRMAKLCVFSLSTSAIPFVLGMDVPQAIMLGLGVSVASSMVAYNVEKENKLRENPYTYLLRVNREFT